MPNRIVRDGILTSERVDGIAGDPATEVFYRRLHSVVDDYGIYHAHSSLLRAALYPLRIDRVSESDIARYLAACVSAGLVRVYGSEGKKYVQLLDFRQRTRAASSKFPQPNGVITDAGRPSGEWRAAVTCQKSDRHVPDEGQAQNNANVENKDVPSTVGQVTDITLADGSPPRAYSYSYSYSETEAGAIPTDQFFEERYALHPKKRDRVLAEQVLCQIASIETAAVQQKFRTGHDAWIATDDFQWKGGAKCPTFASFITDRTWEYQPPSIAEEQQPRKPVFFDIRTITGSSTAAGIGSVESSGLNSDVSRGGYGGGGSENL